MNGSDERALGNYPKEGPLTGLVVGNGMIFLEALPRRYGPTSASFKHRTTYGHSTNRLSRMS
jgi:hypothetical protein